MNAFQLIGVGLSAAFVLLLLGALATRRLRPRAGLPWLVAWAAAGVTIARPELTVQVAHALGIARGADLVFYCSILAGMALFFGAYLRLRRLDAALTTVVRELALLSEKLDGRPDARPAPPVGDDAGRS